MREEREELSIGEALSSIKTALLDEKPAPAAPKKENKNNAPKKSAKSDDVFVLTKNMLANNASQLSLSEKDFNKVSENLLKKYAKIFASWQVFEQKGNE